MRKQNQRIRTDWASLSLSPDGRPVVCLKSNGAPQCLCFDSGEQLKQTLNSGGLSIRRWVVGVPRGVCIVKSLCLPTNDVDEAIQMVKFEIPSLVPLPLEDVTYGCVLAGQGDSQQNTCVWILRKDLLEKYLASLRALGVTPRVVLPDTLAIHRWFNAHNGAHVEGSMMQVLASAHTTTVLVCEGHGLRHVIQHVVPNDAQPVRDAAHAEVSILQQSGYLEGEAATGHVVISGDTRRMSHLEEPLRCLVERSRKDLVVLDAPRAISYFGNGTPASICADFSYETVVAEGLLCLLSDSGHMQANLLPQPSVSRYRRYATVFRGIQVVVWGGVLVLLLWGWLAAGTWRVKQEARAIHAKIAPIRHLAQGVESKRQRLHAIQRQHARRGQIGQIFRELYECTPETISFYEVRGDAQPAGLLIGIRGQADFLPTALEYTNHVGDAELLGDLQIINAQQIPRAGGGSVVEFKASCLVPSVQQ